MPKRPYTREFIAGEAGSSHYNIAAPEPLWSNVKAKAARQGTSVRAVILRLLTAWLEQEETGTRRKRKSVGS